MPAYINKIIAIVIANEINNMDEVFGSLCFDLVISCGLKIGLSSILLLLTPPF
jgi:hypothetical protein